MKIDKVKLQVGDRVKLEFRPSNGGLFIKRGYVTSSRIVGSDGNCTYYVRWNGSNFSQQYSRRELIWVPNGIERAVKRLK